MTESQQDRAKFFEHKILPVSHCSPRITSQNVAKPMIPIDQREGGIPLSAFQTKKISTRARSSTLSGESILSAEIHRLDLTGRLDSTTEERPTANSSPGLLCGLNVVTKFFLVFGQHFGELDPVSHLRVTSNNCAHRKHSLSKLEIHFEDGADGKWEDTLDVATGGAEIGDCATQGNIVARHKQLHRDGHLDTRGASLVWSLPVGGRPILAAVVHCFLHPA